VKVIHSISLSLSHFTSL